MADVTKIKLPDNSEYNLKDHRIPGVDITPTSGSDNVVTSGGVYDKINEKYTKPSTGIPASDLADNVIPYVENFYFVEGTSSQAGNSTSGSYLSTKWEGQIQGGAITQVYNGLKIAYRIKTNTGVSTAGVVLSIDGTHYYPVVIQKNTLVTTHYPVGSTPLMVFNSTQTASAYLTSNTKTTVTGCWQIMEYDSNTNTYQREYVSSGNVEYPITTRYNTTSGESYYAEYGRYSEGVTLNPSTNTITASGFKTTSGTSSQFLKADGSVDSNTYATTSQIPSAVTESTVYGWGFTKNAGTLTGVSFNGTSATVSNGVASISASIPLVIDVGENPTAAPSGTFAQCQSAILANRVVALMVRDDEDDNRYLYVHQDTGTYYGSRFMSITFYRVSENYIYYYTLSPSENLTYGRIQIGTLTGVKFNNTNATINGTVAEITATMPATVTESTVSGWGFTKNTGTYSKPSGGIPATDLESAVQTSLGKADTALQSFTETDPTVPTWAKQSTKPTYTASEVGALPDTTVIPTVPTNVSAFTNDVNYVKYVLCTDEASYNAISNKDNGTLYLIPK